MYVPAATVPPVTICPILIVPVTELTVNVVVLIDPVNVAVVGSAIPLLIQYKISAIRACAKAAAEADPAVPVVYCVVVFPVLRVTAVF